MACECFPILFFATFAASGVIVFFVIRPCAGSLLSSAIRLRRARNLHMEEIQRLARVGSEPSQFSFHHVTFTSTHRPWPRSNIQLQHSTHIHRHTTLQPTLRTPNSGSLLTHPRSHWQPTSHTKPAHHFSAISSFCRERFAQEKARCHTQKTEKRSSRIETESWVCLVDSLFLFCLIVYHIAIA